MKAVAKNPAHPVAGRDAAKKREMEAQDAQAREALKELKKSGCVLWMCMGVGVWMSPSS